MRDIASKRLYRTIDDDVVFEDDPDARFLLCCEGEEIPDGYSEPKVKSTAKPANKSTAKPANK